MSLTSATRSAPVQSMRSCNHSMQRPFGLEKPLRHIGSGIESTSRVAVLGRSCLSGEVALPAPQAAKVRTAAVNSAARMRVMVIEYSG